MTTGSATTITFSAIPATYTNLRLVCYGRDSAAGTGDGSARLQINGDTTSGNYTATTYVGSGASTSAATADGCIIWQMPGVSGNAQAVGLTDILIPSYAGTTFQKQVMSTSADSFGGTPTSTILVMTFVWKSTAAITGLVLTKTTTAFVDGTTATLYGMK